MKSGLPGISGLLVVHENIIIMGTLCRLVYFIMVNPGGPVVIIFASGSEVHGSDPGRGQWIFQSVKILSMTSFGREVKLWVLCRRFTARKRTSTQN